MAYVAVMFLQETLSRLTKTQHDLISGAGEELKLLEKDVALLEALVYLDPLTDRRAKKKKDELEWDILDAVHEVEDAVDAFLSSLGKAKGGCGPDHVNQLAQAARSFREKKLIQKLKLIQNMLNRTERFFEKTGDGSGEHQTKAKKLLRVPSAITRPLWQQQLDNNDVGLRDISEVDRLISYLMEPRDKLGVITLSGVDTTTLAQTVYNSQKIQYEFPTRIWLNMSYCFNEKDKFLNILKQLSSDLSSSSSSLSYHQLLETIRALLAETKFLLVIDGVWTTKLWDAISNIFPHRNKMGKVLITTDSEEVSSHAHRMTKRYPFNMRKLSDSESWTLLELKVYGSTVRGFCTPAIKHTGKSIARQCHGVPLVIALIAGLLRAQLDAIEQNNVDAAYDAWVHMEKRVSIVCVGSFRSIFSEYADWVYNNLPHELSDCFLYLGVFPEDYEIPAWTLTRLWIAERFIHPKEGQSLEEAAQENLKELIVRNLLLIDKMSGNGQVRTCRVPKTMSQFCCLKASKQDLFSIIIKHSDGFNYNHKCRRLILNSNAQEFLSAMPKSKSARSFLCFDNDSDQALNPKYTSAIPDGFRLLRVLDSNKSIKFHQFPKGVIKLIHLRYITLSGDNLHVLPEAISELWNLQTIVIDTMSRQLTVKANIWKMIMLRHLKTSASIILDIKYDDEECDRASDHHHNLQTLTRLSPEYCTENVFGRARNLKTLAIFGKLSNLVDIKSLLKLNCLESLKLVNDLFYEHTPMDRLIQPNIFPISLKNLTLSATFLKWELMSTVFAKIKTLEVLKLKDNAFTGRFWNSVGESGFRSLRFLMIREADLVSWEASGDHFPVLECLVLKNCEKFGEIPVGLAKSLRKLDIDRLGKFAVDSARKIEEEKRKFGCAFKLSVGPGCE